MSTEQSPICVAGRGVVTVTMTFSDFLEHAYMLGLFSLQTLAVCSHTWTLFRPPPPIPLCEWLLLKHQGSTQNSSTQRSLPLITLMQVPLSFTVTAAHMSFKYIVFIFTWFLSFFPLKMNLPESWDLPLVSILISAAKVGAGPLQQPNKYLLSEWSASLQWLKPWLGW